MVLFNVTKLISQYSLLETVQFVSETFLNFLKS